MDQVSSSTDCIPRRDVYLCENCDMVFTDWSDFYLHRQVNHHGRFLCRQSPTRKQLTDLFSKLYIDKSVSVLNKTENKRKHPSESMESDCDTAQETYNLLLRPKNRFRSQEL